jgi:hypothetical protein
MRVERNIFKDSTTTSQTPSLGGLLQDMLPKNKGISNKQTEDPGSQAPILET